MKDHLEASIFGEHEESAERHGHEQEAVAPAPPPRTRREAKEAELAAQRAAKRRGKASRGKPSVLRRLAVIVLALAIVGGGVAIAYTYLRPVVVGFFEPNDYPGPGSGSVRVTRGAGCRGIGHRDGPCRPGRRQDDEGVHRGGERRPEERRHPARCLRDAHPDEGDRRARHPRRPGQPDRDQGRGAGGQVGQGGLPDPVRCHGDTRRGVCQGGQGRCRARVAGLGEGQRRGISSSRRATSSSRTPRRSTICAPWSPSRRSASRRSG